MARDYFLNGETLVKVKGSVAGIQNLAELGLAIDTIVITPNFRHKDIRIDDFGPDIPAEVLWHLSDARIRMTLVHFDRNVLDSCLISSMAGANGGTIPGTFSSCGTPMGGGVALFAVNNFYISLNLLSPVGNKPWRFRTTYLTNPPIEHPLGTGHSLVVLNWRAVPYPISSIELISKGTILWDHTLDT